MSRITISDLAIDSNSFINEVEETEATFVNGGFSEAFASRFLEGYAIFSLQMTKLITDALTTTYLTALKLILKSVKPH